MAEDNLRYKVTADTKGFVQGMSVVDKSLRKTQGGVRRQSQGFTQLAYALDDAQYGFRGVQNNLQQIAVTMGLSGPVILGITALLVVIGKVVDNFESANKELRDAKKNFSALTKVVLSTDAQIIRDGNKIIENEEKSAELLRNQLKNGKTLNYIRKDGVGVYRDLSTAEREQKEGELKGLDDSIAKTKILIQQAKKRIAAEEQIKIAKGRDTNRLDSSIVPSGTSLEELKKWQKQATGLMKNFALAWGVEWKNVGKITVAGGDEIANGIRATRDRLGHNVTELKSDITTAGSAFQAAAASAFSGLGAAIGEALAGDGNFGDKFLKVLGSFMTQFGSALIALGIAEAAWLKSLDPGTKIAAGAALVIAGAAISASYAKKPGGGSRSGFNVGTAAGGGTTPSVIQGSNSNQFTLGEVRLRGQDIIANLQTGNRIRSNKT